MLMIMRLRFVRRHLELGMRVVVVWTIVGVGAPSGLILGCRHVGAVTVRV